MAASSEIVPFEWLTSPASLDPFLSSALNDDNPSNDKDYLHPPQQPQGHHDRTVLHIGSGSSVLGEHLLQDPNQCGFGVSHVVNVDKDGETLGRMEDRWKKNQLVVAQEMSMRTNETTHQRPHGDTMARMPQNKQLSFVTTDFCTDRIDYPDEFFDLIVDKSTLDYALCCDKSAASLLTQVYRLLKQPPFGGGGGGGGVYLVVSFHHADLLRPLLEQLPGAEWDVHHSVMARQPQHLPIIDKQKKCEMTTTTTIVDQNNEIGSTLVATEVQDNTIATTSNRSVSDDTVTVNEHANKGVGELVNKSSSTRSFPPDEQYGPTLNVFCCRRRRRPRQDLITTAAPSSSSSELCWDSVNQHIIKVNDEWFHLQNPMLTADRKQSIITVMPNKVDLPEAYTLIFTEAEQENLTYEHFLEDWAAFLEANPDLPMDTMSAETAIHFLETMQ